MLQRKQAKKSQGKKNLHHAQARPSLGLYRAGTTQFARVGAIIYLFDLIVSIGKRIIILTFFAESKCQIIKHNNEHFSK